MSRLRGMMSNAKDKAKDQAQRVRTSRTKKGGESDEEDSDSEEEWEPARCESGMMQQMAD